MLAPMSWVKSQVGCTRSHSIDRDRARGLWLRMEPNIADGTRSSRVVWLFQAPYPNQQSDLGHATHTKDGCTATWLGCNIFHGTAKRFPTIIIFRDMGLGLISVPVEAGHGSIELPTCATPSPRIAIRPSAIQEAPRVWWFPVPGTVDRSPPPIAKDFDSVRQPDIGLQGLASQ